MRKILFSLIATSAIFYSVNAQTKISFEASEGFTVGALNGQSNWSAWGDAPVGFTAVSTAKASDGTRSVKITSDESVEDYYGVENNSIPFYNKAEISLDINVEATGGSDSFIYLYTADYTPIAAVDFNWSGGVDVLDGDEFAETARSFSANQWYNVKIELDFTAHTAKYYVANSLIHTSSFDESISQYDIIDLATDDYGTGFYVDNIQFKDLTLATSEVSKKDIFRVYPNPIVDVVNFDITGKINSVEVYDAAGKLVKTGKDGAKSINVSELSKGNYVVKVKTENASYTKKVIKK